MQSSLLASALALAGAASVIGLWLAGVHLGEAQRRPGARLAYTHGAVGLAGTAALLGGLAGPARGQHNGVASFGVVSAAMLVAALLLGAALLRARLRRRAPGVLTVGVHATLALFGLMVLAAYVSMS